jgi:hypothetical protein
MFVFSITAGHNFTLNYEKPSKRPNLSICCAIFPLIVFIAEGLAKIFCDMEFEIYTDILL